MDAGSGAVRGVVIVLAAIGALAVLGSFGMLLMHGSMMAGLPFQDGFALMLAACRGMMGG